MDCENCDKLQAEVESLQAKLEEAPTQRRGSLGARIGPYKYEAVRRLIAAVEEHGGVSVKLRMLLQAVKDELDDCAPVVIHE